jgi:transcriptional regulator with XRE-family HTH domain
VSRELGRLVEHRRHELGLTRRDLATRSELSYPYISQIETGDRDPSLRTMHKLAETLEMPVEQLAGMISAETWASQSVSAPSSPSTFEDSLELYRAKVLPSIERKLQSVPPLLRLRLLNELTAAALEELQG